MVIAELLEAVVFEMEFKFKIPISWDYHGMNVEMSTDSRIQVRISHMAHERFAGLSSNGAKLDGSFDIFKG
ncbi:hypothetical protein EGR_07455 [Echinococcus granulosus]|uniref:Uncharacterized protein n=1 Tax=Echinococcus granulosus TaxID=6210 RepID=W6UW62_ECHGR|nr:hypothetical protein EGR_07455 [Echinococcus granulosus]EUB57714.1 hypothetical protein EGR_07455 [Echinococcus granulosus]